MYLNSVVLRIYVAPCPGFNGQNGKWLKIMQFNALVAARFLGEVSTPRGARWRALAAEKPENGRPEARATRVNLLTHVTFSELNPGDLHTLNVFPPPLSAMACPRRCASARSCFVTDCSGKTRAATI